MSALVQPTASKSSMETSTTTTHTSIFSLNPHITHLASNSKEERRASLSLIDSTRVRLTKDVRVLVHASVTSPWYVPNTCSLVLHPLVSCTRPLEQQLGSQGRRSPSTLSCTGTFISTVLQPTLQTVLSIDPTRARRSHPHCCLFGVCPHCSRRACKRTKDVSG